MNRPYFIELTEVNINCTTSGMLEPSNPNRPYYNRVSIKEIGKISLNANNIYIFEENFYYVNENTEKFLVAIHLDEKRSFYVKESYDEIKEKIDNSIKNYLDF